jgi:hypothetical protein
VKSELVKQTRNAFEFLGKLYFETSYLIKEIERLLSQEKEEFLMGRPAGYGVTNRTSTGLEAANVEMWFPKTFTVFFCPKAMTQTKGGVTVTPFSENLRLILIHIQLTGKDLHEPIVLGGRITNIKRKRPEKTSRFEQLMGEFAYFGSKIFSTIPNVSFEDSYCSFQGTFIKKLLYSINSSDDLMKNLVEPVLDLYRA